MKTHDYIKFLTSELFLYAHKSKEEKYKAKQEKELWSTKYFGQLPLAIKYWFKSG